MTRSKVIKSGPRKSNKNLEQVNNATQIPQDRSGQDSKPNRGRPKKATKALQY